MKKICQVKDCDKEVYRSCSYCRKHYERTRRHGAPDIVKQVYRITEKQEQEVIRLLKETKLFLIAGQIILIGLTAGNTKIQA